MDTKFQFPKWTNRLVMALLVGVPISAVYGAIVLFAAVDPQTTHVGYAPEQPVPFSHKLHAGRLKMDCRYCHNTVEQTAHASIPSTQTCINCHSPANGNGAVELTAVHADSPKLAEVHKSWADDTPIRWNRVHDLPDFVQFNHSAHVTRGVSCVSCHGRVDQMDVVSQKATLSMKSCLECHRNPEPHLRPPDMVTNMEWVPPKPASEIGEIVKDHRHIKANQNCSTCHY
ncbi:MAG: cytochrome c3 family protein [Fuerstiella sp.]